MAALTLRELRRISHDVGAPRVLRVEVGADMVGAARQLPNFVPVSKYHSMKAEPDEIGCVEWFHFFRTPSLGKDEWAIPPQ